MDTVSVRCNSCGAPLEAGAGTRFVTCKFCNSQLEIKHTGSSIFTEEIARIARKTEQMAENLEVIKLQNEIEMLDREATTASISEMSQKGGGGPGGVLGLVFAMFSAIVCFGMAAFAGSQKGSGPIMLVFIGMGFFGLIVGLTNFAKSSSLAEKQGAIQRRRDELTRKLEELNNPQEPPLRT